MESNHTHILGDHGGRLGGWFMHTRTWMHVSNTMVGIIGENLRMRDLLAFMSTDVTGSSPDKRVTWARELVDEEADQFLMHSFIDPNSQRPWLAQRMALRVPFSA